MVTLVANQRRQAGGSCEVLDSEERQKIFQDQATHLLLFLTAQGASTATARAAVVDGATTLQGTVTLNPTVAVRSASA